MSGMRDIQKAVQFLSNTGSSMIMGTRAKVVTVNDNRTAKVKFIDTDFEIDQVKLQAVPGLSEGIYIKPAVGSDVVVMWLDSKNPVIVLTGSVESISLLGDELGGLVNAKELKEQLDKTNDLLNSLLDIINGSPVTEPGNGAPSALQVALKSAITAKELGTYDKIENAKITQA